MALRNAGGIAVSFDSEELIRELRRDIAEFGAGKRVHVWQRQQEGVLLCVNYDFISPEDPVRMSELRPGEALVTMTMGELLPLLEQQNSIF